jgi:cytochrome c
MTHERNANPKRIAKTVLLGAAALGAMLLPGAFADQAVAQDPGSASPRAIILPLADANRGRQLFVSKGCVICHSVNGVGGKAAPALDVIAPEEGEPPLPVDPLGFAARMWLGASAMLELQAIELGYQIELSAEELADLASFASDAGVQSGFTVEQIPEPMRDWMLDQPYWEQDDWPEKLFEENPASDNRG